MQWLLSKKMGAVIRLQILDETVCILQNTKTFGNGMKPIILAPDPSE